MHRTCITTTLASPSIKATPRSAVQRLTLAGREIRAYLNDRDADSSLDKALADGTAKIDGVVSKPGAQIRSRTGTGEHSEYYADEGKVILQGGHPLVVDNVRGPANN